MSTTHSTTSTTHLSAADVEKLDIEEVLRGIFASDVDLKDLLSKGLEQIEQTEKIIRKSEREAKKAERKAAREVKAMENLEFNAHRLRAGVHVALAAGCVVPAIMLPGANIGLFGLGATQLLRAGRSTDKAIKARRVRNAIRMGAILEVNNEADLREALGDVRFEAILAAVDAGFMVQMGWVSKDPFFMVLAAIDALAAGWGGAVWANRHQELVALTEAQAPKAKATKVAAAGAHRGTRRVKGLVTL